MRQPRKWVTVTERRLNGEWVRWRRRMRALSQGQLAEVAGVSRQTINNIETGRHSARPDLSERLNEVLS